jgi:hypothetical protein
MVNWYYNLSMHDLAIVVMAFVWVNMILNILQLSLKWLIWRSHLAYFSAARDEQLTVTMLLNSVKDTMGVIRGWAELARIQTSNAREAGKELEKSVDKNTGRIVDEIKGVPDKVVSKIESHKSSESGLFEYKPRGVDGQ